MGHDKAIPSPTRSLDFVCIKAWQTLATVSPSVHLVRSIKIRLSLSHQLARLYTTRLPTPISTSKFPQCSPRNDSLLRTTLALPQLPTYDPLYLRATRSTRPRLNQCTVKTGISIYRPQHSSNAASSPRNDSLLRTAPALQQLAYVRLAVPASNQIDTPPVNPTYYQNRDIYLPFNDSIDLSFPLRSSSCIQRLDRSQLPATIVQLHPTT